MLASIDTIWVHVFHNIQFGVVNFCSKNVITLQSISVNIYHNHSTDSIKQ